MDPERKPPDPALREFNSTYTLKSWVLLWSVLLSFHLLLKLLDSLVLFDFLTEKYVNFIF